MLLMLLLINVIMLLFTCFDKKTRNVTNSLLSLIDQASNCHYLRICGWVDEVEAKQREGLFKPLLVSC